MSFNRLFDSPKSTLLAAVFLFLVFHLTAIPIQAQTEIDFVVGSAWPNAGDIGVEIPIYVQNFNDSIAGYAFWLQLSNPGVAQFQVTFDTAGTLSSGWQYVDANSLSGTGHDLKVVALANTVPPPFHPALPPQDGSVPLIKVLIDIEPIPDTLVHRVTEILPNTMLDHFGFSDPQGQLIGVVVDSILDSTCWVCTQWAGPDCLNWTQSAVGPCDSIYISWQPYTYMDTSAIHVTAGYIFIQPDFVCGDFTVDGEVNISDLTSYVDYMFAGGSLPLFWQTMDCDASGQLDVIDLTCFVDFMFAAGDPPLCLPTQ